MIMMEKIFQKPSGNPMDSNIIMAYEIENSCWVWYPGLSRLQEVMLLFRNEFDLDSDREILIHISGDQRYELSINGDLLSIGPDRSDLDHWSFASYRIKFPRGKNVIEALLWWVGDKAPRAQISHRGGFIFSAEGEMGKILNTGKGHWTVKKVEGSRFSTPLAPGFVGHNHIIDGNRYFSPGDFVPVEIIEGPISNRSYAIKRDSWGLYPTSLPDQILKKSQLGRVKAFFPKGLKESDLVKKENMTDPGTDHYQLLFDGSEITIPKASEISILIDLEDYYCAYPVAELSGGINSSIEIKWSEGLYHEDGVSKGNRNNVENKKIIGNYDTFIANGENHKIYKPCW